MPTSNENNTKTLLNGNDISIIDATITQPLMDIIKAFLKEPLYAIEAIQFCVNDKTSESDIYRFKEAGILESIQQIHEIYSDKAPQNLLQLRQRNSKANAASIRLHISSKIEKLIETLKNIQKDSFLQSFITENLESFKDLMDAIEFADLASLSIKDLKKLILKPDDVYRLIHKANMSIHAILNLSKSTREFLLEHSAVIGKLQDEVHIAWHSLISFPTDKFQFVLQNVGAFANLAKHDPSVSDKILISSLDELECFINRAEGNSSLNNNNNFATQASAVILTQTTSAAVSLTNLIHYYGAEPEPDIHESNLTNYYNQNNRSTMYQQPLPIAHIQSLLNEHPKLTHKTFNEIWPSERPFTRSHKDLIEILIAYKESSIIMALFEVRGKTEQEALQEIRCYQHPVSKNVSL